MEATTNQYHQLPLSSIIVNRESRQRRELDTKGLEDSIQRLGVLNPIIVSHEPCEVWCLETIDKRMWGHDLGHGTYFPGPCEECLKLGWINDEGKYIPVYTEDSYDGHRFVLVAGERRLQACRNLGLPTIPARLTAELPPLELQIVELEENIKRTDLSWPDQVRAAARIHALYKELDPEWTQSETAHSISVARSHLTLWLRVAAELDSNKRLLEAASAREAFNIIARRESREQASAIETLLEPPLVIPAKHSISTVEPSVEPPAELPAEPPSLEESILEESFLEWAPRYDGPKFNFIHCDFPFGFSSPGSSDQLHTGEEAFYENSPALYTALLECLCENLPRLLSISGHLMFWFSFKEYQQTIETFKKMAPRLEVWPHPLIWIKSNNAGIAEDPRHGPRHIYETALLLSAGTRQICRIVSDAYSAPSDRNPHPSHKPEPMLRHFFTMLVDNNSQVLDPTCGSGTALRAAESLGATHVLGLETNPQYRETARQLLKNSRLLRRSIS